MPSFLKSAESQTNVAAIDLGSNALRAVIARVNGSEVEIIKNVRTPLRLGEDVFALGKISDQKMELTEHAFIKLLHLFVEYNVTSISAKATSAMRDALNGTVLANTIYHATGIDIQTIQGTEEARLIFEIVKQQLPLKNKTALLMDIGGGSTELTVVKDEEILGIHSFNVGTVRLLRYKNQEELEVHLRLQVQKMVRFIQTELGSKKLDLFIGTGGNLRRIGKIRKKILGKPTSQMAMQDEIHHMKESISSMSYVDRIRRLELDQNRADVILPAIMLTHLLMEKFKMEKIYLPKVGLKEGILLQMLPGTQKFILKD